MFGWKDVRKIAKVVTKVAEVASFIPGPIGTVASGIAVVGNLAQGNYKAAALSAIGLLGVGGTAKLGAKLTKNVKIIGSIGKKLDKAADVYNNSKIVRNVVGKQANKKFIGRNSRLFGNSNGALLNSGRFRLGWSTVGKKEAVKIGENPNSIVYRFGLPGKNRHLFNIFTGLHK